MTAQPPVLLLDVDGVVNAISAKPPRTTWPAGEWTVTSAEADGRMWRVLTARPVVGFLNDLSRTGRVEVRWHTTWGSAARENLAPLIGLDDFPVVSGGEVRAPTGYRAVVEDDGTWWKLPAAEDVLVLEGRAVIWLDDDIDFYTRWPGLGALAHRPDVLAISPRTPLGLSPRNLRAVTAWLEEREARGG